jgi:hypothetical protein
MAERKYDSTVARIAGNIMSGASALWVNGVSYGAVARAVETARLIVEETKRTEPPKDAA